MNQLRSRKVMAALSLLTGTIASPLAVTGIAQTTIKTDNDVQTLEKFTVTGSYLPPSAAVGPSPVDIITEKQITSSGVTDTLQLLKKLNPAFQGNGNIGTETNNGGSGESNASLRNLTTLILINNRRVVGSPNSNGSSVDLNTIPLAAIDKIEILKDGASTIYGSDAIGGVVNIILKKNYTGFEVGGSYGQTTHGADYTTRSFYVTGGVARDGNSITVTAQYYKNDQLASNKRKISSLSIPELVALGQTNPPSYFSGSFAGRVGNDVLAGSPLAAGAPGYKATLTTPPIRTSPSQPGQTLAQLEAAGVYIPISSTTLSKAIGGGVTILDTTSFGTASVVPTDRREVVLNSEHELFGKNLVAFTDILVANTINAGTVLAPSPLAGVGANNLTIPANNPYNPFGVTIGIGQAAGAPAVRTRLEDIGNRRANNDTTTYRVVAGLKGEINENYSWETSVNYGRAATTTNTFGGANGSIMNQLLTPQVVNGAYVYDAAGKPLSVYSDSLGAVPVYNFFGIAGSNDPRTVKAIQTVLLQTGTTEQKLIDLVFKGTPFELPAGKIAFAVGGEYRKESLSSTVDGLYANGLALGYNAASTFSGGSRQIKSVFAELNVPIFSSSYNVPGAHGLDLNLSGRREDLGPPGVSNVPKIGLRWQPLDDTLTLRATYAKGFIAPSIYSLFGPPGGNSPTFTILEGNGSGSPGGSTGRLVTGQFGAAVSELSNPNLAPSKSKSHTFGVVYSPKGLRGLTVSVDYYYIEQDHVGSIDYTSIYADLNAKGSGSVYASGFLFQDGTKLTTTAQNQVTSTNAGNLSVATNPSGSQKTNGLDFQMDYKLPGFGSYGEATVGVNGTVTFDYKYQATGNSPFYQYARQYTSAAYGLGGNNGALPGYQIQPHVVYAVKNVSATLLANYIPSITDQGSLFAGQTTTNATRLDGKAYEIDSFLSFDFSLTYDFSTKSSGFTKWLDGTAVTVGVNNFTDEKSPFIPTATEDNTSKQTSDIIGRFFVVSARKKF